MPRRSSFFVFLIACFAVSPGEALITVSNLLPNDHFDAGIDAWSGAPPAVTWAAFFDASDDPESGSLRIRVGGEVGAVVESRACVRIVGGELHVFGASYFIPLAQVPSGEARVIIQWFDDPGCVDSMSSDSVPYDQDHGVVAAWTSLVATATPPVNSDSASLILSGWKLAGQENQPEFVIYFDDASLLPEPGFALGACAAFATLWLRRRLAAQ